MQNEHIIVRVRHLTHDSHQENNSRFPIQRICGYLDVLDFCKLMYSAENKVNPRNACENSVVKKIRETLETNSEQFWIKSRGILVATQQCIRLERNRVRLSFNQQDSEGIMDGGHNTLAIASYLLHSLLNINLRKISEWKECKKCWQEHYDEVVKALMDTMDAEQAYNFLIPIEIIAPLNDSVPGVTPTQVYESREYFHNYLPDICAARNTNVQLKETAKSNQLGLYELLKAYVPDPNVIEWKTGDNKQGVRCEDIVALACLPLWKLIELGKLELESPITFNTKSLYSQKGKCVEFYSKIITDKNVSHYDTGKYIIHNQLVKSALSMIGELMRFFDRLYLIFPDMYNRIGAFGHITSVKSGRETEVHFRTTTKKCDKSYPDGFIYPLFCGVSSLMKFNNESRRLEWEIAPSSISDNELIHENNQNRYVGVIKLLNYDPQKVGKEDHSYDMAALMFEDILRRK